MLYLNSIFNVVVCLMAFCETRVHCAGIDFDDDRIQKENKNKMIDFWWQTKQSKRHFSIDSKCSASGNLVSIWIDCLWSHQIFIWSEQYDNDKNTLKGNRLVSLGDKLRAKKKSNHWNLWWRKCLTVSSCSSSGRKKISPFYSFKCVGTLLPMQRSNAVQIVANGQNAFRKTIWTRRKKKGHHQSTGARSSN